MKTIIRNSQRPIVPMAGIILLSFFFGFSGTIAAPDWNFVPTPISTSNGAMNSLHFIDKNTGWIVGNSSLGDIIHTTNGGIDWVVQATPVSAYIISIFFANADTGFVVGSKFETGAPIIFRTTDGGQEWLQLASPVAQGSLNDVYLVSATRGWAVGEDTHTKQTLILRTSDGQNWETVTHPAHEGSLAAVTFADSTHGWTVGSTSLYPYQPIILGTADGGQTWIEKTQPLTKGHLADVVFVSPDSGWAAGKEGGGVAVLKTTDGGLNWSETSTPSGRSASSLCFISPTDGYLAVNGDSSRLYKTNDGGDSWVQVASAVADQYIDKVQVVRGSIHIFLLFSRILALLEEYGDLVRIEIKPPDRKIAFKDSTIFDAEGYNKDGGQVPISPTWSTTGGKIRQDGTYIATEAGDFVVTATDPITGIQGTAAVHVNPAGIVQAEEVMKSFVLAQNYPNPFNPGTTIRYGVPGTSMVVIKVFDVLGHEIRLLVKGEQAAGDYEVVWDGNDQVNNKVASGIYFVRFQAGHLVATKKMILMR